MAQQDEVRRFYRESGPDGRRRVVTFFTDHLLQQTAIGPQALYRYLLADDSLLGESETRTVESAFTQIGAFLAVPDDEIRSAMADILGERVRRFVYDTHTGLYRYTLDPRGRYLTESERTLEMLTTLKARVEAERALGGLGDVPERLPDGFPALVNTDHASPEDRR